MAIERDGERLGAVASQLGAAAQAAERGERVRLPVLQARDVAGITLAMHEALDDAIAARSVAAREAGVHIACSAGCSACCVAPVIVSEGEAVTVAQWLGEREHAAVRARFLRAYRAWRTGAGSAVDAIHAARDDGARRAAAIELKRKAVMCAFNDGGLCTIYEARPARCRRAHALDTNARCGADGDGEVAYFEHAPTEMMFAEQQPMHAIIHHALRRGGDAELLCAAVFRLLEADLPRNAPCPCGSGAKFKRCCGAL